MTSFRVTDIDIEDLREDVLMNENLKLYDFVGNDPVKAFYLGLNIAKWGSDLENSQKYLYNKTMRHLPESIEKYLEQIKFWADQYPNESCDYIDMAEYVYNNMIYFDEKDNIKMALYLGFKGSKYLE